MKIGGTSSTSLWGHTDGNNCNQSFAHFLTQEKIHLIEKMKICCQKDDSQNKEH